MTNPTKIKRQGDCETGQVKVWTWCWGLQEDFSEEGVGNSAEAGRMERDWLSRFMGRKQVQAEKTSTFEGADVERSRGCLGK